MAPTRSESSLSALLALFLAAGCGIGLVDNQSGGSDHLPTQAAGPYGKLALDRDTPAEEPFVVRAFPDSLTDPSVLRRDDGGFLIWFGRTTSTAPDESQIWYAEIPAVTELPDVPPEPALVADAAWEEAWVGAPSVVRLDAEHLVMFYQGGRTSPALGRADSMDDGRNWTKHPANPLLDTTAQPSAVVLDHGDATTWLLFASRPDRAGIFRADSSDGTSWAYLPEPVLTPRETTPEAFDRYAVFSPHVVVQETASSRLHYSMFFNATDSPDPDASVSVGWAGSFDGIEWRRFESPDGPILAPEGASERAPAVLLEPDRGIMFYSEPSRGAPAIAVAMHP